MSLSVVRKEEKDWKEKKVLGRILDLGKSSLINNQLQKWENLVCFIFYNWLFIDVERENYCFSCITQKSYRILQVF